MAIDNMTYPPRALDRELVTICVLFGFDNTTLTRLEGPATVTRAGTGSYKLTFPFDLKIRGISVTPLQDGLAGSGKGITAVAEYTEVDSARELNIFLFDVDDNGFPVNPSKFDMAGGDMISVVIYHQNTSE